MREEVVDHVSDRFLLVVGGDDDAHLVLLEIELARGVVGVVVVFHRVDVEVVAGSGNGSMRSPPLTAVIIASVNSTRPVRGEGEVLRSSHRCAAENIGADAARSVSGRAGFSSSRTMRPSGDLDAVVLPDQALVAGLMDPQPRSPSPGSVSTCAVVGIEIELVAEDSRTAPKLSVASSYPRARPTLGSGHSE